MKTTKYFEDTTPSVCDPFYRGRGRSGGRQDWISERPTERSNRGIRRGTPIGIIEMLERKYIKLILQEISRQMGRRLVSTN